MRSEGDQMAGDGDGDGDGDGEGEGAVYHPLACKMLRYTK